MTNHTDVPVRGVVPIDQLAGDDETDTALLKEMAAIAIEFLKSFRWVRKIKRTYFGDGYGGVIAVFLFNIEPSSPGVDEWLWVIVGDTPPAYLVIDLSRTPSEALSAYIEEMLKWANAAERGESLDKMIPVCATATPEDVKDLRSRLNFFSAKIVPAFKEAEMIRP